MRNEDEPELKRMIREYQIMGHLGYEIMEMLNLSRGEYTRLDEENKREIARDYIENASDKKAQAIIDFKDTIIQQMEAWDRITASSKVTEKQKDRITRNKKKAFMDMVKTQANITMDYTCKEQNKALEELSKKLILRAKEYSQRFNREPVEHVIESWMKENQRG